MSGLAVTHLTVSGENCRTASLHFTLKIVVDDDDEDDGDNDDGDNNDDGSRIGLNIHNTTQCNTTEYN